MSVDREIHVVTCCDRLGRALGSVMRWAQSSVRRNVVEEAS
jgi:hypothetical protein